MPLPQRLATETMRMKIFIRGAVGTLDSEVVRHALQGHTVVAVDIVSPAAGKGRVTG